MQQDRTLLFEETPIPKAVATLAVPTILSSLVMVLYNLADTYFVGMLGDPVQNAAVTLAAPVMLAFNAVNNLFGVGSSSMMSRALGRRDYDTVAKSSTFGFWCAILSGLAFSLLCILFKGPLLGLLGAVIAFFLQWALYAAVARGVDSNDTLQLIQVMPFSELWAPVAAVFALAGIVIGVGGSLSAIRKFLQV